MINTTWQYKIQSTIPYIVDTQQKDIIKSMSVSLTAQDDIDAEKKASWSTVVTFNVEDGVEGDFILLEDITNTTLETWVTNYFGADYIANVVSETTDIAENGFPEDDIPEIDLSEYVVSGENTVELP